MARKRIALSVRPEYHDKLLKLAEYQNTTITGVVGELLSECESAVDVILKAYAEIEKGVDKICKKIGEEAKVAIRNIRRDMTDDLKKLEKSENLPEDLIKTVLYNCFEHTS